MNENSFNLKVEQEMETDDQHCIINLSSLINIISICCHDNIYLPIEDNKHTAEMLLS